MVLHRFWGPILEVLPNCTWRENLGKACNHVKFCKRSVWLKMFTPPAHPVIRKRHLLAQKNPHGISFIHIKSFYVRLPFRPISSVVINHYAYLYNHSMLYYLIFLIVYQWFCSVSQEDSDNSRQYTVHPNRFAQPQPSPHRHWHKIHTCKWKHRGSMFPLSRLVRCHGCNHSTPIEWIRTCSIERSEWQVRVARLSAMMKYTHIHWSSIG